ncbi:hypothetical protein RUM43_001918 [Polyplax serrata]|uniref:Uncharacterized protein n=1 Tax=Polyplax serrata TaxID=468196 RepID=A0AAN8XQM0_POLSC
MGDAGGSFTLCLPNDSSARSLAVSVTKLTPVRQTAQVETTTTTSTVTPPEDKPEEPAPSPPKPHERKRDSI